MEYKEFVEYIKMNAGYIAGEGGNITINHVIKNNGCEMDGLVIMQTRLFLDLGTKSEMFIQRYVPIFPHGPQT